MRVGLREGWIGRKRGLSVCPICESSRVRFSRRRYENAAAFMLKVRPAKCLACGVYFPVGDKTVGLGGNLGDFELPFDLDEPRGERFPGSAPISLTADSSPGPPGSRCPQCGARSARPARTGMEPSPLRLDANVLYRCSSCNASFNRISPLRLVVLLLLLSSVLGAAAHLFSKRRSASPSSQSPSLRRNQLPEVPPPVFNRRLSTSDSSRGSPRRVP